MALHKLVRRNYGRKLLISIKYQNFHSFKEGLILLCRSILEVRRITYLHGSDLFPIPLSRVKIIFFSKQLKLPQQFFCQQKCVLLWQSCQQLLIVVNSGGIQSTGVKWYNINRPFFISPSKKLLLPSLVICLSFGQTLMNTKWFWSMTFSY